jgi:hypothetical protein
MLMKNTDSSNRQRVRRDQRPPTPTPMRLTARDLQILQAVYEYGVLSTQQFKILFFPSLHQAYARLAQLYHHGYLDRRFLGVYVHMMNTPILYVLDKRGGEVLRRELGMEVEGGKGFKQVTPTFLEHAMEINDVRVAVAKACGITSGYRLVRWDGENELKKGYDRVTIRNEQGRSVHISLIPDSYFVLETPRGIAHFFLELDRGTMTTKRFKSKVQAYQGYYASGAYQQRYETKSLRILTVTTSQARLESLKRVTEEAGGKQRFWFTTLDRIQPATVLTIPIWEVATNPTRQPLVEE